MKGYKAILEELSRTAYNIPAGELQELISKPEEELTEEDSRKIADTLKERHRQVITSINKTAELKLDEKFKAGERKKATEFEKLLKETFGIDSDKQGAELIEDISTQLAAKSKGKDKNDLTDDDVKKHATFLRMEAEYKKQLQTLKDEHKKELDGIQAKATRKEIFAEVSKAGMEHFDSMNPVLSEDAKKAAAQRSLVLEKLEGYDYQKVDGKYVPIYPAGHEKAGQRVEDEFGHAVELDKLVETVTSPYFDFRVAEQREAPNGDDKGGKGGQGGDAGKGSSYKGKLPKTEEEYRTMMNDTNIPIKDRMAINDHWEKSSGKTS